MAAIIIITLIGFLISLHLNMWTLYSSNQNY